MGRDGVFLLGGTGSIGRALAAERLMGNEVATHVIGRNDGDL